MNRLFFILFLLIHFVGHLPLKAQKITDFGDVPRGDLSMTQFPEDPEADAVYLFDVGDLTLRKSSSSFFVALERRVRIKILSEAGKAYANVRIPYWAEEKVDGIRAHTVLPNGEKVKLEKADIFQENLQSYQYTTFAIPGVQVGAVIEYQYKLESPYISFLEPWYFQNPAYTKVSRYSVSVLPHFYYTAFFRNSNGLQPETREIEDPYTRERLQQYTWTLTDQPPIREEPYMRSLNDYRAALHFQIQKYSSPSLHLEYIKDWPTLVKEAWDDYDNLMSKDKLLKSVVSRTIVDSLDNETQIRRLYEFVRDSVKNDDSRKQFMELSTRDVLKSRKGRPAEKNLLLVNLLSLAGFESWPLLVSTRNNGRLIELHPNFNQFNLILAYVKDNEKTYILDTRDPFCPFKLIPVNDIVERGLVVNKKDGEFIDLPIPGQINMAYCRTTAALDETGDLKADVMIRYENYRAMEARRKIYEYGEKEFVENLLRERFGNALLLTSSIEGKSAIDKPLIVQISFTVEDFAQVNGDLIYLPAIAMNYIQANIFQRENRYYPVEYGFGLAARDDVTLSVPKGYIVEELPASGGMNLKIEKLVFLKFWENAANTVKIQRQMMIRKQEYSVAEYPLLREFYDHMVQADQGQIVLKKMGGME